MSPYLRAAPCCLWGAPALLALVGCSLNPPLRVADEVEAVEPVELSGVPLHAQEAHHCGPASLLTVLEASGVRPAYDEVVARVYTPGLQGSLQAEMTAAARAFGRISYLLPGEPAVVFAEVAAGRPVLVLLNLGVPSRPTWHYAVVVGFDPGRNRIVLHSGRDERVRQRARPWMRRWEWAGRWAMVLLRPGELPADADRDRLFTALADFEESADPAAAGIAWRAAAERWPDAPLAWLGVGNAAYRLDDGEAAHQAYRRVLELDPGYLPARLNLATLLAEEGRACEGTVVLGAAPAPDHPLAAAHGELERRLVESCPNPGLDW